MALLRSHHNKQHDTIADLQAKEAAYGHRLTSWSISTLIGGYAIIMFAFAYLLYANLWIAIVLFLVAALVAYRSILPREIAVRYYRRGFQQRNRCLNILSQLLAAPDADVFHALTVTTEKMHGEFRQDLDRLNAALTDVSDRATVHQAFMDIQNKYYDDVIFSQFFEQLETAFYEGTYNIDTFQDLKNYHNQLFEFRNAYTRKRLMRRNQMIIITLVIFVFLAAVAFSDTYYNWIHVFAHSFFGIITISIFIGLYVFVASKFFKYFYDESITTL